MQSISAPNVVVFDGKINSRQRIDLAITRSIELARGGYSDQQIHDIIVKEKLVSPDTLVGTGLTHVPAASVIKNPVKLIAFKEGSQESIDNAVIKVMTDAVLAQMAESDKADIKSPYRAIVSQADRRATAETMAKQIFATDQAAKTMAYNTLQKSRTEWIKFECESKPTTPGKIRNPKTGKEVKIDGKLGQSILAAQNGQFQHTPPTTKKVGVDYSSMIAPPANLNFAEIPLKKSPHPTQGSPQQPLSPGQMQMYMQIQQQMHQMQPLPPVTQF